LRVKLYNTQRCPYARRTKMGPAREGYIASKVQSTLS
jgi:hypothetical protein